MLNPFQVGVWVQTPSRLRLGEFLGLSACQKHGDVCAQECHKDLGVKHTLEEFPSFLLPRDRDLRMIALGVLRLQVPVQGSAFMDRLRIQETRALGESAGEKIQPRGRLGAALD